MDLAAIEYTDELDGSKCTYWHPHTGEPLGAIWWLSPDHTRFADAANKIANRNRSATDIDRRSDMCEQLAAIALRTDMTDSKIPGCEEKISTPDQFHKFLMRHPDIMIQSDRWVADRANFIVRATQD